VTLRSPHGLTIVEVLIAIVLLSVGMLALASNSGVITRTLTGSKMSTAATQQAARELDRLRAAAGATSPRCMSASFASGGPVVRQNVTLSWTVSGTSLRTVRVIASYPIGPGTRRVDTLTTTIAC
jgi:type IV pilus assembly protein PilV